MFVTCLYILLDPQTGHLRFANAGHNLPYQRTAQGVIELRARGMPLGLMPEMTYEEKEADLAPGDTIILYSDGLVEAHNKQGEMFGFPHLREMLTRPTCSEQLIGCLVAELGDFAGSDWEQEDDVTLVSVERTGESAPLEPVRPEPAVQAAAPVLGTPVTGEGPCPDGSGEDGWRSIAAFEVPSQPGNERQAMEQVASVVEGLHLPGTQLEHLKTAVAEATMNAMEHGNHYAPDKPVEIEVLVCQPAAGAETPINRLAVRRLAVRIRDQGGNVVIPESESPDLDAKLAGLQSPRGWGLFLIKNMVDEMHVSIDETHHTLELVLYIESEAK